MEHLVGDVGERNEVVLTAIDLPLIDLGEERVMALENGDFGGLHNGGAQIAAATLGYPAAADLLAAVELLDVEAGGGHELASAVLILGMKHRQDLGEDRGRPDRPEPWNGLQEGLLLTHEVPQLFVELRDLVDEQVDALHNEADLQGQMLLAMGEREGVPDGRLQGLGPIASEGPAAGILHQPCQAPDVNARQLIGGGELSQHGTAGGAEQIGKVLVVFGKGQVEETDEMAFFGLDGLSALEAQPCQITYLTASQKQALSARSWSLSRRARLTRSGLHLLYEDR